MGRRGETIQSEILAVLRRSGAPLSAYDVLGELRAAYPKLAPPTIYRALSALMERGRVHRLESLNAYIACRCGSHQDASVLSICGDCGTVEESVLPDFLERLSSAVGKSGFAAHRHVIEIHGVCAACGDGQASA